MKDNSNYLVNDLLDKRYFDEILEESYCSEEMDLNYVDSLDDEIKELIRHNHTVKVGW